MYTRMYIHMYICICAHRHRQRHVRVPHRQTHINFGYAVLDTLMIRPILIDPKVSILHMYNFSMFLQFRTISVTKVTIIDKFGMRLT